MNRLQSKGLLERGAAADLWRRTLSQIPSVFGRLAYLSSLRDPNTGRYEHYGLAQSFGEDESDRVLRASHEEAFGQWLCQNLEQQQADLDLYFSGLNGSRATVIQTWMRLAPYRHLVPSAAREMEHHLYVTDIEALLAVLANRYGITAGDPDA